MYIQPFSQYPTYRSWLYHGHLLLCFITVQHCWVRCDNSLGSVLEKPMGESLSPSSRLLFPLWLMGGVCLDPSGCYGENNERSGVTRDYPPCIALGLAMLRKRVPPDVRLLPSFRHATVVNLPGTVLHFLLQTPL